MPSDDEQRINEIKARVRAATPGPWECGGPTKIALSFDSEAHIIPPDTYESHGFQYGGPIATVSVSEEAEDWPFIQHSREDVPWLLERLAASIAREARLREAVGALRAKLAPEWWREDEREWFVHCSLCAAYGPRDDFWHFEDCVLGQALASTAPAAGGQPRDGEEAAG